MNPGVATGELDETRSFNGVELSNDWTFTRTPGSIYTFGGALAATHADYRYTRHSEFSPEVSAAAPACVGITVHEAWRFRGGSTFSNVPDDRELLAVDFSHGPLERVRASLHDESGRLLSSDLQWVKLDEHGKPYDRFYKSFSARAARVAVIFDAPRGTTSALFVVEGACRKSLTFRGGPEWPPMPKREPYFHTASPLPATSRTMPTAQTTA
jgi:hypothetical protein